MSIDTMVMSGAQLYPLPENWNWTNLKKVVSISKEKTDTFTDSSVKYIGLEHMEKDAGIVSYGSPTEIRSTKNVFHSGQILYGKLRPYLNKHDVAKFDGVCSTDILVLSVLPNAIPKFVDYFLNQRSFIEYAVSNSKGINLPRVSGKEALEASFPLPPVSEQQRIVDRIESLFAKLDEAKEKAQAVVDGFEDRKAAILHKAFTGELTAEWRNETKIDRSSWQLVSVKDICHDVKVGIVIKPSQYYTDQSEGTPAFRSANVREFHVDDFDWVYLNEEGMTENQRSIVHTGNVLVVRSGNPGTACVVEEKYDGYNAIDILIAVPDQSKITPEYLCAFTNSPSGRKLVAENKRGMALAHFNVSGYSALVLELPSIAEQKEIVRIMHDMLEKEEKSKEAAQQVISQIDTMKKAILARAFRGELGTNDPSEPPADISIS